MTPPVSESDRWCRRDILGVVIGGSTVSVAGCAADIGGDTGTDGSRLEPGEYKSVVIFRNDDPHPEYRQEALIDIEDVFIDESVPVTHGIIPAKPGAEITGDGPFCERLRERLDEYPELFSISLHGYTHQAETDFFGSSEFGGLPPDVQAERIEAGIDLLATCVDRTPRSFIPPFDTYDEHTVKAAVEADIPVISGGSWFTDEKFDTDSLPFKAKGALHVPRTHAFVRDWKTGDFHDAEDMHAAFDAAHEAGELYVQMLHYQHFTTQDRLDQLRGLIQHMKQRGSVGFMSLDGFAEAYQLGEIRRTDDGWLYEPDYSE